MHVLDGSTRSYFIKKLAPTSTFSEIETVLLREYNSDDRQLKLQSQRKTRAASKNKIYEGNGNIRRYRSVIRNFLDYGGPHSTVPSKFRSDDHKVYYLRRAVSDYAEWSLVTIEPTSTRKCNFSALVTVIQE